MIWQIGWKERRGGELRLKETGSIWAVMGWMIRNLHRCTIVVVTRMQDD